MDDRYIVLANKRPSKYQNKQREIGRKIAVEVLNEIIKEWNKLLKRYTLTVEDMPMVSKCQKTAESILKLYPELSKELFMDYYDEAICEYIGIEYIMRRDKQAQVNSGFNPLIINGKGVYLFPWN